MLKFFFDNVSSEIILLQTHVHAHTHTHTHTYIYIERKIYDYYIIPTLVGRYEIQNLIKIGWKQTDSYRDEWKKIESDRKRWTWIRELTIISDIIKQEKIEGRKTRMENNWWCPRNVS